MLHTTPATIARGTATSHDGTPVGYLRTGSGPAVVVLHGSMETSASHLLLAEQLADRFTVYLPDRRGRGASGPHRADHCARTEVEDLAAVLAASGARLAFGVSAGGLVVLEAARTLPHLDRIALYEPALAMRPDEHRTWLARFDREVAEGHLGAAMVTSMYGLDLAPGFLKVVPRSLLARATESMMRREDAAAAPDQVTMRKLAPTIHAEGALIAELAGTAEAYRQVGAQVLLLGGTKGLRFLRPGRDALERVLPSVTRRELPGLDHGASSDPSEMNRGGSVERVTEIADAVRAFFSA